MAGSWQVLGWFWPVFFLRLLEKHVPKAIHTHTQRHTHKHTHIHTYTQTHIHIGYFYE